MKNTVQWRGDNVAECAALLHAHQARADMQSGGQLHIHGEGLDTTVDLGDRLIIDGDRLGILRVNPSSDAPKETWVTWQGNNLAKVGQFLKDYDVRIQARGRYLDLYGNYSRDRGESPWFTLNLGDRLIKRDGQIIVSKHA